VSVDCFSYGNLCWTDVFVETLSPTQCTDAGSLYTLLTTNCPSDSCGYSFLISYTKMTVELGLQVCNSYGFKYAALSG